MKIRPNKKLGQNFLVDPVVIERIIAATGFSRQDTVLEIGAGLGALTLPLSKFVGHVVAVEKDRRLVDSLKGELNRLKIPNVTLVQEDILSFDFASIQPAPSTKIQVAGNLPYNISSPVLKKLMENRGGIAKAVLMFQWEVAKRLTAVPGNRDYGSMTLFIQYHASVKPVLEVGRRAFFPRPGVDSMVVALDFEKPYPKRALCDDCFSSTVKAAFSHRRKTLLNSMGISGGGWSREDLLEGMICCGIDPGRRAETLTMDEYLCLTSALAVDRKEME